MVPEKLPDIIISTLGFNASVLALLFAAQGFVLARMWPEGGKFFRMRLLWIVPAFLLSLYVFYSLAGDYLGLIRSVSERTTIVFIASFINHFWRFYGFLLAAVVATGVSAAAARD
jgi:hypothetical protein